MEMPDTTDMTDEEVRTLATLMVLTMPMAIPGESRLVSRIERKQREWAEALRPVLEMLASEP